MIREKKNVIHTTIFTIKKKCEERIENVIQ